MTFFATLGEVASVISINLLNMAVMCHVNTDFIRILQFFELLNFPAGKERAINFVVVIKICSFLSIDAVGCCTLLKKLLHINYRRIVFLARFILFCVKGTCSKPL